MCLLKIITFVCGLRKFFKIHSLRKKVHFRGFYKNLPIYNYSLVRETTKNMDFA